MERGTERKLERYPQGVDKRKEKGGIGGDAEGLLKIPTKR
jgi:hypothetical protein